MGGVREVRPLSRLLEALEKEKIRFILIGMSAAITQGVMGSTLDVDLWIDLPPRNYMRVMNLCLAMGGQMGANTVVFLEDGTPVNFVFKVTGLGTFSNELRHTLPISFLGRKIPVLSLERICVSKRAIGRDKDKLHLLQIAEFLRCRKAIRGHKRC